MAFRIIKDAAARHTFRLFTLAVCAMALPLAVSLFLKSLPVLKMQSLGAILFSTEWHPMQGEFGMLAYIMGTATVTGLAMLIAVPVSLLAAIYLAEYSPARFRQMVLPLIDLLSGIPSVIYGVWGIVVIVPAARWLSQRFGAWSSGYCLLSGALVLAVMVCPFIIHVAREVLSTVPFGIREASLSLGATKWQTVKLTVLRKALPGIVAAVILGLSRALGETIAVLMVIGNVPAIPKSLFDPAYPLPALLANNYGEMMSVPLYDSALLMSGFILLVTVLIANLAAKGILRAMQRGQI
ncbi:MAG TPA: phosphate ABC transporter permease subunit PstC [Kiritimatiellia bacterium]|nr:phosphate ABC transporter permease subunit PstC [Kiritimatiellia bacterium]HPA77522.1 phosphate ABC transporter permease subunit PstC [Kiritimatiellia bacterium]